MALLFYSPSEERKCSDGSLKSLCEGEENCPRKILLKALGSGELSSGAKYHCCNSCNPVCPYTELRLSVVSLSRKNAKLEYVLSHQK